MLSLRVQRASCIILSIFVFQAFSTSTTSNLRCLVCNTTASGCEDGSLAHSKECPLLQADSCFTAVQHGKLLRGCLSQLSSAETMQCREGNGSSCIICTAADCNRNQWLKCDQCDSDEGTERCTDKRNADAPFCPRFKSGDRCYEMRQSSNRHAVLQRGCQSSLEAVGIECTEETHCINYTEQDINLIDREQGSDQTRKCLICSTDAVNGEQCDKASLEAESCQLVDDECISMVQDDVLHRKCKSSLSPEQQQLCTGSNEGVCITCNENGCNRHTLLKCIQCKKSIDPVCRDPSLSAALGPKYCSRFHQGAQCYSRILNEDVERGCTSDAGLTESVCDGNKYCLSCATNGCNKETEDFLRDVARCMRCRSSKGENINCEEAYGETEECDQQEDECFTRVEGETIERNCLATLSEEDQRKCLNAEDNTCLACHGHDCNRIQWRKCYTCSKLQDPRCVDPESQPSLPVLFCDRYRYEDVCYAKIVNENDLVRGCGSDLAEDEEVCEGDSRCMKCDVNGCNSISESALVTRSKCLSCVSSIDGEECEQGTVEPVICEANSGCYTRVDDGVLERGCIAELDVISEQLCLDVEDTSCIVCEEPSCNNLSWLKCIKCKKSVNPACTNPLETSVEDLSSFCSKYSSESSCFTRATELDLERGCSLELPNPALVCDNTIGCTTCLEANCNNQPEDSLREGVRCVQCSSSDTDCNGASLPEANECPSTNQHCFTRIDDGTLVRGCLTSLSQELQESCEDENNPSCIACPEDGCNTQKWPRCYRCTSSSDERCDGSLIPEHLNFCDAYSVNNFCHSWIQDGEVSRDCTTDKETVCSNNNRCLVCEEEGCNSHSRELLDTVQTCFRCSSSTEQCDRMEGTGTECGQRSDRCYTQVADGVLTRGCLSDMESEAECLNAPSDQCLVCDDNDCNKQSWNTCYQCSNTTDVDCAEEQKNERELTYCPRYDANGECYVSLSEERFTRGCLLDRDNKPCDDPWQCVSCVGSGCNEGSSESYFASAYCFQCRSDTHRECLNGTMESVKCGKPADLCFYHRVTSRIIERGCFSDLSPVLQTTCSATSSRSCLTCSGPDCNGVHWRRCYQCSSFLEAECELRQSDETHLWFCLNATDHCFEERDGEEIHRGCGESYCDHKKTCVQCDGDGCNGNAGSTLLPSRCSVCDTTDATCVNGSQFVVYCDYLREKCYSMVRADGILERGCFSQLDDSFKSTCLDPNDRSCVVCSWNSCNRAQWRQCTQCTSTEHGALCSRGTSQVKARFCKQLQHYDRCYAKDVEGVVTRGCVSDFEPTEDICYGLTQTKCFTCDSDNCNDRSLNAAPRVIELHSLLATVLLLLVNISNTLLI